MYSFIYSEIKIDLYKRHVGSIEPNFLSQKGEQILIRGAHDRTAEAPSEKIQVQWTA